MSDAMTQTVGGMTVAIHYIDRMNARVGGFLSYIDPRGVECTAFVLFNLTGEVLTAAAGPKDRQAGWHYACLPAGYEQIWRLPADWEARLSYDTYSYVWRHEEVPATVCICIGAPARDCAIHGNPK